jgi:hypothetical protein
MNSHTNRHTLAACGTVTLHHPWREATMVKKMLKFGGIAFVIYFVTQRPDDAGDGVRRVLSSVGAVANGFATFAASVIGG